MKISVIIPTIRWEMLFDYELPGFSNQTFPKDEFEIILVDDYPYNRSPIVKAFSKKNQLNIKWMRSKQPYYRSNANIGNARNTGLIYAEGELVIFIDDYSYVRPEYLETMWSAYKENFGFSPVGPVVAVEPSDPPYPDASKLKIHKDDMRVKSVRDDSILDIIECPSKWFFTSNASAPLREIIKVNGFLELADLTREEDVIMGSALAKNGCQFCYLNNPKTTVYHVLHNETVGGVYKNVTYQDLGWSTAKIDGRTVEGGGDGGWCGLMTEDNEVQLITKDIFNTKYPGSWALLEFFSGNPLYKFNMETGFDLEKERKKIGNWT